MEKYSSNVDVSLSPELQNNDMLLGLLI